jgi:hypothetical protein
MIPKTETIDNITFRPITREELKTYKSTMEWEEDKIYLLLYGTGSYSIAVGDKGETHEEIIKKYREEIARKWLEEYGDALRKEYVNNR